MQHPFFKETAKEMVNRLFDEWVKKNTFDNNILLAIPLAREGAIKELEDYDKIILKLHKLKGYTEMKSDEVSDIMREQMVKSARENFVLKELATTFAYLFNATLKNIHPKPTHRQTHQKSNHLRLVVNG